VLALSAPPPDRLAAHRLAVRTAYLEQWERRIAPPRPPVQVVQRGAANPPDRRPPAPGVLDGPMWDRTLADWSGDCGRDHCGILIPHAHRDHFLDSIASRPTLGAIRQSQKHNAEVHERARRVRQSNPMPDSGAVGYAPPMGTCAWCGRRQHVRLQLCQDCTWLYERRRARLLAWGTETPRPIVLVPIRTPDGGLRYVRQVQADDFAAEDEDDEEAEEA
jgi:hypothetical protein